jgi:hypothetical protein
MRTHNDTETRGAQKFGANYSRRAENRKLFVSYLPPPERLASRSLPPQVEWLVIGGPCAATDYHPSRSAHTTVRNRSRREVRNRGTPRNAYFAHELHGVLWGRNRRASCLPTLTAGNQVTRYHSEGN